jgi:hypothetical protein
MKIGGLRGQRMRFGWHERDVGRKAWNCFLPWMSSGVYQSPRVRDDIATNKIYSLRNLMFETFCTSNAIFNSLGELKFKFSRGGTEIWLKDITS